MDGSPVFRRGHSCLSAEKTAQRRLVGKSGLPGYIFYIEVRIAKQGFDADHQVVCNHLIGSLPVYFLHDLTKVDRGDTQFIGIESHFPLCGVIFGNECSEFAGNLLFIRV